MSDKHAFSNGPFQKGLTMREWFAGQALIGYLSNTSLTSAATLILNEGHRDVLAKACYEHADAMIAESERTGK